MFKRIISLMIIVVAGLSMIFMLDECNGGGKTTLAENTDSLQICLAGYNKKLPISVGDNSLDSVYYDSGGNTAVFNYIVTDDLQENLTPQNARKLVEQMLTGSREAWDMYNELARNQVAIRTVIMGEHNRNTCVVELTEAQVLAIKPGTARKQEDAAMTSLDSLNLALDSINALCPDTINSKTLLVKVQVENNYVVYNYVVEETKVNTLDKQKASLPAWKASQEKQLQSPSPEMKSLMILCVDNGLGMKHRYVGRDTKQSLDYAFTATQLSAMSKHPLPEGYEEVKERTKEPAKVVEVN